MEGHSPLAGLDDWYPGRGARANRSHPGVRPGAGSMAGTGSVGRFVSGHTGGARDTDLPGCGGNPPRALGCHRGVWLCRGPGSGALRGPGRWSGAGRLAAFGAAALGEEPAPLAASRRRWALGCGRHCARHGLDLCLSPRTSAAPHGRLAAAGIEGAWLAGTAHPRGHRSGGAGGAVFDLAHGADNERLHAGIGGAGRWD